MARLYIYPTAKLGDLSTKQALDVNAELSSMTIENELRRKITEKIRLLRDMGSYRGRRHAQRLPVRGQNTQSQVSALSHCYTLGKGWMAELCVSVEKDGVQTE